MARATLLQLAATKTATSGQFQQQWPLRIMVIDLYVLARLAHLEPIGTAMDASSHKEKLLSGLGGMVSIFIVFWITDMSEQALNVRLLYIASMGATAVLLFAAPHVAFAQPWNVIGGHIVSALVGVTCHNWISDQYLGGALAVGVAITLMYYLHCLHPPGGATALVAVIGGPTVDSFGYIYALVPVGLGAALMVVIAIQFNYPFPRRRYPEALFPIRNSPAQVAHDPIYPDISHADLVAALSEIDTFMDVSERELLRIYELATRRKHPALSNSDNEA